MGQAPDMATVYAFEDNIEGGFKTLLQTMGFPCYTQRDDIADVDGDSGVKVTPRFELQCVIVQTTQHRAKDNSGVTRDDAFEFEFHILFVTDRHENFADHTAMLSKLRAFFGDVKNNVNGDGTTFPYYSIAMMRHAGTIPGIQTEAMTDQSFLTYSCYFQILPGAWPAV